MVVISVLAWSEHGGANMAEKPMYITATADQSRNESILHTVDAAFVLTVPREIIHNLASALPVSVIQRVRRDISLLCFKSLQPHRKQIPFEPSSSGMTDKRNLTAHILPNVQCCGEIMRLPRRHLFHAHIPNDCAGARDSPK